MLPLGGVIKTAVLMTPAMWENSAKLGPLSAQTVVFEGPDLSLLSQLGARKDKIGAKLDPFAAKSLKQERENTFQGEDAKTVE
eukprot:4827894-Karenia_brevis.AAC.1